MDWLALLLLHNLLEPGHGVQRLEPGQVPRHPVPVLGVGGDGVTPEGDRVQLGAEEQEADRVKRIHFIAMK